MRSHAPCRLVVCTIRSATCLQTQRRWAQVHDVRFLATRQPSQVVLEKYRDKLDRKAREEGLDSIDGLKSAYASRIEAERRRDAIEYQAPTIPQAPGTPLTQPNKGPTPSQRESSSSPSKGSSVPSGASTKSAIQSLDELVDVAKIRELPEKELTAVWRLRHANSTQKLCAVIPATSYRAMEELARNSPHFVLPVPHDKQGAEIHFLQWTFDAATNSSTVLFTQLAEFKARGEFAQPHTTVTHHLDLAHDNGLVLMQGQTLDGRGVSTEHAKWLVLCLQRFYGAWDGKGAELDGLRKERADERRKLVEWFANGDARFSIEKLLEEAERMG